MTDREHYAPGPAREARVEKDRGQNGEEKWTLVLVRELRHTPEKVWEAITDPAHLREWAPFDADASLGKVGTTVKLTTVGAPTPRVTETTVTRADAPKALEYNWGGSDMRWQLEAFGSGTRLTLWTNIGHRFIAMGAAGWHICFDVLDHLLSGTPIGRMVGPEAMKFGGWQRLNAEYAKQFGIESHGLQEIRAASGGSKIVNRGGGHIELEQMDSADPQLAVHCLYGGRRRQRRHRGTGEV